MRILLNTTNEELAFLGGDQKYYRTLLASSHVYPGIECRILRDTSSRLRHRVRQLEPLATHVRSDLLRQGLYAQARRLPIYRKDLDADVVFSTVLAARPPKKVHIPQVWYSQGISPASYYESTGSFSLKDVAALYRRIAPHVDLIIVGTYDGTQRLQSLCPELPCPVVTIPQLIYVDSKTDMGTKLEAEKARFLFVGQDFRRKGLPEVLDAYRHVCRDKASCELHIVTSANCPLARMNDDLRNVMWHFNVSDAELEHLYVKCNVLVVPTHADTYNLVIVEAMAFGMAIITSNLAPLAEISPHSEVGLCIEPGDVKSLTQAMEVMIAEPSQRRQYMRNSLERYGRTYAPEIVMPQLLGALERTIT